MNALAFPIIIPLFFVVLFILINSHQWARRVAILGGTLLLGVSLFLFVQVLAQKVLVLNVGGWPAPFGISLVMDIFSGLMLLASSFIVFVISLYAHEFVPNQEVKKRFYLFFFALVMGVNGAFITGDVFNLYVWFEVMLMASFVMISMESSRHQLEGGIKYMALNLVGSLFFLAGLGLLYGKTGTLSMAHLAQLMNGGEPIQMMNLPAVLFFVAFGIKAAIFPLFFWLPSSYHTPGITVTSLFAGLLTKVGVYALIRFFTLFFVQDQEFWHTLLMILAGLTMVVGGMAASTHFETRRILSYHIISQIGYMIMGLAIYTPLAIAGAIFFTIHNMIAKTNTFLISGVINKLQGTYYLKNVGGLYRRQPFLAILFFIPAMALAGIPPLSGFFGKIMLVKAGFDSRDYLITAVAIYTGILTLYSMVKIWNEAFLKKDPDENRQEPFKTPGWGELLPSVLLGMASIAMGLFAAYIFDYTLEAANQLLDSSVYVKHVLNP
jgi:multicomponent Na+:H+ antiporter subunit D